MPDTDKKNNSKRNISLSKISFLLSIVAGIAILALLIVLCVTDNAEVSQSRTNKGYFQIEVYTCREVEDDDTPIGVKKEYTFMLDESLDRDTHLAFYTVHQYVDVYIDGQSIYRLQPSEKNRMSKTVGSNWTMIPIYREDAGKEVCVEITPVYESFRNREIDFLIGSELAIYKERLSKDLPQLILGAMAVFVGLVFICVAVYNIFKKHRGKGLAALGLFSVMLGFWRLTDTRFTPFIFPNRPVLLFYISVVGSKLPYICAVGVIGDVVAFYVKGNSSGLLFSLLAFLLYIVFMGIATMFNYSEQELQLAEKDRQLAEQERKLTERRISVMMSQIRTHFIFNVLTTISTYCKSDAKKADDALIRFSRYLRRNIKIIEQEGLIDFQTEMEQLEDYIALEQLRFGDMIIFTKELEVTSFQLPPLTIQPIVENAIKHGLVEHDKSGVITLQTVREKDSIVITVADDGVGFVPEECEKEDSVGIKNVRYRLENMVGGSLTIESAPGEGTTVIIKVPVRRR